jgi:pentatricopeptide repeat protein
VHLLPHHLRGGIGTPARAKTQIASLFTAPIASIAMTANGTLSKNSNSNNNHHNHIHNHNHNHNKTRTRHISSTPPTYSPYHRERGFHENITQRLLATEIGALNQASLLELRTAISSWYSQAAANPNDTQAFYQAKALLHRILQEVEYSFQQHDKSDITGDITGNITGNISRSNHKIPKSDLEVDKMLDITTINFVLDSWRLINNHKSMQVKNNKREMTDEETIFVNDGLKVLNRICKVAQKYEYDYDTIHDTIHDNDNGGLITHPDVKSFNLILDGLSKFGMVDQAKALFQQMQNLAQHRNQAQCRPQIISYNSLLSAYANSKTNQVECAQQASDLLDEMLNVYNQTRNPDIKPDKYSFAIVISAYANAASMSSDAPYQAENILKTMIELCNSSLIQNGGDGEWADLKPDHIHYTSLISAWSNSGLSEAVDRAAGIVSSMQTVISGNNEDVENISTVMSTFSDGRDGLKVEGLIDKMLSIYESDGDESMMPTTMTFTALIDCLSESAAQKVGGDDGAAAIRSENILKKMEELYEAGHAQLKPTVPVYNVLIKAWAKSMRSDAGIKAEALMEKMKDLDESGGYDLKPDVVTFSSTILAYANANDGINAERIFMQMYQVYQDGDADCLPNAIVCSAVINAYGNEGKPNEAERVLDMMNNMDGINVEVDEYCLNCVLKAYLNSTERNNIHKAIEFLSKMDSDGTSSSISYNSVLDQLSKIGQKWAEEKGVHLLENMWNLYHEGNNKVKPDSITYNSLINLLAKSRNPYTAKKAIYYFKDLQRQYNESGDPKLMPVRVTYNATLSAFTALKPNEKDIQEAEALVNEMKDLHSRGHVNVKPDAFTMTSLISCYANSNVENAGERAEELLQDMQELFDNGNESMRPTTASFGAVLNAWARQGNAIRAQAIVDHMETLKDTYNEMSANNVIYNTLINSWAKYGTKESGEKAEEILEKMKDMYEQGNKEVKPTRISYNRYVLYDSFQKV